MTLDIESVKYDELNHRIPKKTGVLKKRAKDLAKFLVTKADNEKFNGTIDK